MIQCGERLRLAFEPREPVRIGGKELRQDLDGHVAIELRIARPIHLAHSASANGAGDLVRAEACADLQGQRELRLRRIIERSP